MRTSLAALFDDGAGHPGLRLDFGLENFTPEARAKLFDALVSKGAPSLYTAAYERWENWVVQRGLAHRKSVLAGRLFIGLGNASVHETHITLHPVFGVPMIPGDALKGMARAAARRLKAMGWELTTSQEQYLFGELDGGAYATVHDAWWIPASGGPFALEVDTPHHPDYYRSEGATPATDFDDPNPVQHLAAKGSFLFVVECADGDAARLLLHILLNGLTIQGVGGRVNADYGRFL